jgi:hypothetical protein
VEAVSVSYGGTSRWSVTHVLVPDADAMPMYDEWGMVLVTGWVTCPLGTREQ